MLTPDAFLTFVRSVLDGLPSSSSTSTTTHSNEALFGEIVVDMVWSIDAELEEIQADAKVAIANAEQAPQSSTSTIPCTHHSKLMVLLKL